MNTYKYRVFGITIDSELEIPELEKDIDNTPECVIKFGEVPKNLDTVRAKGVLYEAAKNDFIFCLDTVGSYRVQDGNKITIQLNQNSIYDEVRLFLLGPVFGALLHQRNIIPIHGSTIVRNNSGFIIAGRSTAGKSSIAAGFMNRGYSILSDDISALTRDNNNEFVIHPGVPYLKLWDDVIKYFGYPTNLNKVRPKLEKYKLPFEQYNTNPVQLNCIIILDSKNISGFSLYKMEGTEKFNALRMITYRNQYIFGLEKSKDNFNTLSALSQIIPVYKILRPVIPLLINDLVDFIQREIPFQNHI